MLEEVQWFVNMEKSVPKIETTQYSYNLVEYTAWRSSNKNQL